MSCIGIRTDCLPNHMHFPVGCLTFFYQRIQCPCCNPHDIASCFVVFRILYRNLCTVNQRFQQPFHQIIRSIVICSGKILFQNVRHNIKESSNHLILWQRKSKDWIQNREFWQNSFPEYMPDFQLLFMVGDNRACVHF